MPLRDHFHPPLSERRSWDMLHGGWPMKLVEHLASRLPAPYVAAPGVHLGSQMEIDIVAFEDANYSPTGSQNGGVALYAPAKPAIDTEVELLDVDEYEVRVYDADRDWHLVAAIELVSPANKDRPRHRQQFVDKCAKLLSQDVSVMIVDVVTNRAANLFHELLESLGAAAGGESSSVYAAACRTVTSGRRPRLQSWPEPVAVGQPLPTLPLWLSEDLAIRLDLEPSYEETCRILRM